MTRRRRWVVAAVVVLLAVVIAIFLWPGDRNRLQGTWAADGVRLTFDGDVAVLDGPAYGEPRRSYFRLDPWASPKQIVTCDADAPDIRRPPRFLGVSFGAPTAGRPETECRGIYELSGSRLRVCMSPPGGDFPATFEAGAGVLFDLRRE
ncbi:MAG TPA: hypothetical protein VKD90_01765 [Gemmataceae bacterium]|nr:hypothetical protein [Gemmataceae bacterium]